MKDKRFQKSHFDLLAAYSAEYGRTWKYRLTEAWMNDAPEQRGDLRRLRNSPLYESIADIFECYEAARRDPTLIVADLAAVRHDEEILGRDPTFDAVRSHREYHYDEAQLYTTFHGRPETSLAVRENQESGVACEQADKDLSFLAMAGNAHAVLVKALERIVAGSRADPQDSDHLSRREMGMVASAALAHVGADANLQDAAPVRKPIRGMTP